MTNVTNTPLVETLYQILDVDNMEDALASAQLLREMSVTTLDLEAAASAVIEDNERLRQVIDDLNDLLFDEPDCDGCTLDNMCLRCKVEGVLEELA
jgi:hypothetical protein